MSADPTVLSLMLIVPDGTAAVRWYTEARGFVDPFGHAWSVGDRSPLASHPE